MKFNRKFFPVQQENRNFQIRNLNMINQTFIPQQYSFEANLQIDHLRNLFMDKLNSLNCFSRVKSFFSQIIDNLIIMESEIIQKMFFDENYFKTQVKLLINYICPTERNRIL